MSVPKIIVYSSTGCPHCEKVKSALKNWGFEYEDRNASVHKQYFDDLRERKIMGTPATFIDGKLVLGFQEKKFKKLLGITEVPVPEPAADPAPKTEQAQDPVSVFKPVTQEVFDTVYDFVTIGGGPAGASAAVYASRSKLKTLVIDKAPKAGTLAITHKIANYPGVREELTGLELLTRMQAQASDFGAEFVHTTVLSVNFSDEIKKIEVAEGTILAKSVFIAVGAKAPSSKITGEDEFIGRGVSYCSTCDGAFYQDREVTVVGDNDEAIHEAETLAKFCKTVKLIVPTQVKGDTDLSSLEAMPNVEIYHRYRLKEIKGENSVERIVVLDHNKEQQTWDVDGVFLYLAGMKPGTDFLENTVNRDHEGYIIVDDHLRTSADGVFAGGDARRTPIKQAVISAADGAIAALGAEQHVSNRAKLRPQYS